mmetsp:Transcript_31271/g.89711  ORF Transcript_31271/g.89711 Transcript_31271/m.89711 type:complete len:270 (-) Transcript_31271:447-1256(-)
MPRAGKEVRELALLVARRVPRNAACPHVHCDEAAILQAAKRRPQPGGLMPDRRRRRKEHVEDLCHEKGRRVFRKAECRAGPAQLWRLKECPDHPVVHRQDEDWVWIGSQTPNVSLELAPLVMVRAVPQHPRCLDAATHSPVDQPGRQERLQREGALRVYQEDTPRQHREQKGCDYAVQAVAMAAALCERLAAVNQHFHIHAPSLHATCERLHAFAVKLHVLCKARGQRRVWRPSRGPVASRLRAGGRSRTAHVRSLARIRKVGSLRIQT